jgi:hypothetical protein
MNAIASLALLRAFRGLHCAITTGVLGMTRAAMSEADGLILRLTIAPLDLNCRRFQLRIVLPNGGKELTKIGKLGGRIGASQLAEWSGRDTRLGLLHNRITGITFPTRLTF